MATTVRIEAVTPLAGMIAAATAEARPRIGPFLCPRMRDSNKVGRRNTSRIHDLVLIWIYFVFPLKYDVRQ